MGEQVATPMYVGLGDVCKFVLCMLEVCSVCSTEHVAGLYSHTSRPAHRAWTVLEHLRQRDYIETHRTHMNVPAVHRLSKRIRRKFGLPLVRWNSQLDHRLMITQQYVELGYPEGFIVEPRREFEWRGNKHVLSPDAYYGGMLIEVQRSYIESERWAKKRRLYELYFNSGLWQMDFDTKPTVVIVQYHNQQTQTIGSGIGYSLHVVNRISDVIRPPH